MDEPRRVLGSENQVRIDAEVYTDKLTPAAALALKYDITNQRDTTILIADMVPMTSYDPETQTVTIDIGSEVPGQDLLPRLIAIGPGEKKTFSTTARVRLVVPTAATPHTRFPNALRFKVNFLGDPTPFQQLIEIPEKGIHDPKLADELFPKWLEQNETVFTNTLPMQWSYVGGERGQLAPIDSASPGSVRRRGGGRRP